VIFPVVFLVIAAVLLLVLPRRSAVIPLLLAAAYTTRAPVLELGPASLSVLRVLVIVGAVRVLARGERIANGLNAVDLLLFAWATFLIGIGVFHTSEVLIFRLGLVLGELGVYMLCRVFIQDAEDVRRLFKILCLALVPLAVLMLLEKQTAQNFFGGGINIRDGHVRAYGPFAHSILAGTVGATCLPMALCLWRTHRKSALIGLCATAGIVFACTSSGPIMMTAFICAGLLLWNVRNTLGLVRWGTVAAIIGLQIVMNDPVYFLMARIDLTGSSTGWHRAELIRTSIAHLNEWWAVGTDVTRHWMPTGIHANEFDTDITNHFLEMGVWGGLPLLILFVLMLWAAFREVGKAVHENEGRSPERAFLIWTLGAMLFGHVVNFWSISLFDQSVSFFYLVLATIGAIGLPVAAVASEKLPVGAARWQAGRGFREEQAVNAPAASGLDGLSGRPPRVVNSWPRSSPSIELGGKYRVGNGG
jgi:hypothetical protein